MDINNNNIEDDDDEGDGSDSSSDGNDDSCTETSSNETTDDDGCTETSDDETTGDDDGSCTESSLSETNNNDNKNTWKRNNELRDLFRLTRDCVKSFETSVSLQTLKHTRDLCAESIKQVGNFFVAEKLKAPQSAGLLHIIAKIIYQVLNLIKSKENLTKLGQDVVIHSVDTFVELIEEIMSKVGSYEATQSWIQCSSLKNLSNAFPIESCVVRKRLTYAELQVHSNLLLFKRDLLRYRCNILNESFGGACKTYWITFSHLPGQRIFQKKGPSLVENEINKIENYFSVTSDNDEATTYVDVKDDGEEKEFKYFESEIKRQVSSLVEEKNVGHVKYPLRAQQNVQTGVQIYPIGVIPPHYVSLRKGVWTLPGMETNIFEPVCSNLLNSSEKE